MSELQKMKFFQEREKVSIMEHLEHKWRILINILWFPKVKKWILAWKSCKTMISGVPAGRGFFFVRGAVGTPRQAPTPPGTPGSTQANSQAFRQCFATRCFAFASVSLCFSFALLSLCFKLETNCETIRFRKTTRQIIIPTRRWVGGLWFTCVCIRSIALLIYLCIVFCVDVCHLFVQLFMFSFI